MRCCLDGFINPRPISIPCGDLSACAGFTDIVQLPSQYGFVDYGRAPSTSGTLGYDMHLYVILLAQPHAAVEAQVQALTFLLPIPPSPVLPSSARFALDLCCCLLSMIHPITYAART
jgi:hypothetical protein